MNRRRENLLVLLRSYHEAPTLLEPSTQETKLFTEELEKAKDTVIGMVLGMGRPDGMFTDYSSELNTLAVKVKPLPTHIGLAKEERELIGSKINQLLTIVTIAKQEQTSA